MSQESDYLIAYGPDANCTLALCSVHRSVYGYRPSLAANGTFLALFAVNLVAHAVQGIFYSRRYLPFAILMIVGCVDEMLGYGGRILLHQNPFSFTGFMIQICCISTAPAFFSAAIYLTITQIVEYLGPQHSRFRPKLFYWLFIPCDVFSLTLQAAGGALSSSSSGTSQVAVDVAIAGLSFQVITLTIFVLLSLDYGIRWSRLATAEEKSRADFLHFRIFVTLLTLAIMLILARCGYRIDELSEGYQGSKITVQGLFIGLEGVLIVVAAFCLNLGHPGFGIPTIHNKEHHLSKDDQEVTLKEGATSKNEAEKFTVLAPRRSSEELGFANDIADTHPN